MAVRFGLDIGIASVGWAVVEDDYTVLEAGANLFTAAEASENVTRRSMRQAKRLLRRRRTRLKDFECFWEKAELSIPDAECNNQLQLRVDGLKKKISTENIYHVLHNMLTHRGISYLDDALDESSTGKSDYEKGILANQKELVTKLPCEIQLERLQTYGKYRGNITIQNEKGEKITLSNIFTVGAYVKEIRSFLEKQKEYHAFITDEFIEQYLLIFQRKREYYVGPGNELSRTDYGKYTTRINPETGEYITEKNIFEKLIGKCTVYPDKFRAAGATYTAQEFNVLNDLNNLCINERKLTKEEKTDIIELIKNSNTVNMRKIIKKVIGEDIITMTGARIDKSDKEIFHSFEQYNKFRKEFEKRGLDFAVLTVDELDIIGNVLTLNTEKEATLEALEKEGLTLSTDVLECLIDIRKKNGSSFNKWQSFSLDIMKELIPEMYEQPKNQMQLLTDMGVFKKNIEYLTTCKKIPKDEVTKEIYNPVVRRSIRITVDIINALIKKWGNPSEIVIEMPRDKNSDEEKKRIADSQKKNEKELNDIIKRIREEYGINITSEDFRKHNKLALKLKLWNEQDGKCLYSGNVINIQDLLHNPNLFEVDHIIPKSISFDDSRTNKVLVYATENQLKGNQTPYMYLKNVSREWDFDEYMNLVLELKGKKNISKKKFDNLFFREDITKIDVLKGFVSRNINDTRYASRVVLNVLQNYFRAKELPTKVKVIRGSFTHQMRMDLQLPKNREETYAHHAVDAMLICYSQMGYEAYRKVQKEFIDFENEELLSKELWDGAMDTETCEDIMYKNRMQMIKKNLSEGEAKIKYWHKVDRKPNRGLCNQTIRGTRIVDDKIMKINKLNIYNDCNKLIKMIKAGEERKFLMFHNDPRTWQDLITICNEYQDISNPFVAYERETGDYFRKYSKKHNGPKIENLKYMDGEVGSCIDISHKYGLERGSRKVILESLKPYRMDVYYNEKEEKYCLIGLKYSDLKFDRGKYIIDKDAYNRILKNEKMIKEGQTRDDFIASGYEYYFSMYRDELIEYEKGGEYYTERFLSRTKPNARNYIETKPIDASKFSKQNLVGLGKTKHIRKIRVDILGNRYYCNKEKFSFYIDSMR